MGKRIKEARVRELLPYLSLQMKRKGREEMRHQQVVVRQRQDEVQPVRPV